MGSLPRTGAAVGEWGMSESYPDFVARFYDVVYAQVRGGIDDAFYLRQATGSDGPALELGVGTGRLFCAARQAGVDIDGVDLSSSMVARCREKLPPPDRTRVQVADAVHMRSSRRYRLVLAPFRMLSHVLEIDDQIRLLDNVFDHLLPGGRFVFDVFVPNPRMLAEGLPRTLDFEGEYAPGHRLQRFTSARSDLLRQVTDATMSFVWDEDGQTHSRDWHFRMRFFFRWEIEHLIARSRLHLVSIRGDFAGSALGPDSREMVVTCLRPEVP
jgi:SAM-dependent methyltransferase